MDKEYRCDIDYKIINLQDGTTNAEKRMNELAAQGYKLHSQSCGIAMMMKETYSEKTESKSEYTDFICDIGSFYGLRATINERTSQYCKGSIYITNYTYSYEEVVKITRSFACYLANEYHVKAQVIARRDDDSELDICCIEALPEEERY